jgi:hypothetical protein
MNSTFFMQLTYTQLTLIYALFLVIKKLSCKHFTHNFMNNLIIDYSQSFHNFHIELHAKFDKISKIMQEDQMRNLQPVTQQDNDKYANMTHDEVESLSNKFDCHESNYITNHQDA